MHLRLGVELAMVYLPRIEATLIILLVAVFFSSCQTGQNEGVEDPFVASGPEQSEEVLLTVENTETHNSILYTWFKDHLNVQNA